MFCPIKQPFYPLLRKPSRVLHNAIIRYVIPSMLLPSSLRQKITLAYLLVAALILAVSLFTFESLKRIETRVLLSEQISGLFESAMEIRRFERNYFLHAQAADLAENAAFIDRLETMLADGRQGFALLEAPGQIEALREKTGKYRQQISLYASSPANAPQRHELENQVRATGKELVATAEALVQTERKVMQTSLSSFRITLAFIVAGLALFMIALGQALSRRVAQPLQQMENYVAAISAGSRDTLPLPSQDREIVSITLAFNHMLKELEVRQKHLLRSEKLASLGTLLSGVAHELNNPLSNIWSSCQILQEELNEADPAHQQVLLAQIDEQCERARHIVSSLQDFARERHFSREHFSLAATGGTNLAIRQGGSSKPGGDHAGYRRDPLSVCGPAAHATGVPEPYQERAGCHSRPRQYRHCGALATGK